MCLQWRMEWVPWMFRRDSQLLLPFWAQTIRPSLGPPSLTPPASYTKVPAPWGLSLTFKKINSVIKIKFMEKEVAVHSSILVFLPGKAHGQRSLGQGGAAVYGVTWLSTCTHEEGGGRWIGSNILLKLKKKLIYPTINLSEVYNSGVFSIFTELCNHHDLILEYFHTPLKETP